MPVKNRIDADVYARTVKASNGITGTLTGNVTGNVTGNLTGAVNHPVQTLTASGAITITSGIVKLNHATVVIAATLAAPVAGAELFIIDGSASGTAAHTVTLTGATFNVTGNTIATLNAPDEVLHIVAESATQWRIVSNMNGVALSGP
jgi:hypothetical protein